ncbi:hypothetical protein JQ559_00920 [Bradyrhizobium viridifuturi]|jgi:hypothetical protein|nr:hypothetical protein [Bradyrhizobium viridifuturi]MCA3792664.1 hypothetical protein [Burkholderia sp.]OYU64239.1 MAG: hypothetical protein CFE30_01135 [Bradyrhizobium sp. PARBB1]PSO25760.1 hypothetical protein C7G43_14870 [Bradyrhizobium sp. MOS004]QRI67835.1 hypothetical protein JQ507_23085 [Bradyrhizobium sp. PSBB068]HAR17412.1 hypothetical protein [Bradyrhizobium sp.]
MALVIVAIFDLIWLGAGYAVARLVLPLVSFGKVRAAPFESDGFNWFGWRRNEVGCLEIKATLAALVGLLICCAGLAVALYFSH